jgi:predicted ATPase
MGLELSRVYQLGQLADVYGKAGQAEEGLRLLGQALAAVRNAEGRFSDAELSRLKGELMLACSAEPHAEGEACFRQARDIARRQQAKSWALRAAMSLARLWQQQVRRAEAQDLLAPIYGWFTERAGRCWDYAATGRSSTLRSMSGYQR